ncbi:MAG: cation:proton antiporter [Terriglobales bacterium]
MNLLLAFAITLVVAVLISNIAERSVLSVAVFFLGAGMLLGTRVFGTIPQANSAVLRTLAEIALFSVLFTDGMRTGGIREIRSHWHYPGRALLIGMPLTIAGIALLAYFLVGLSWPAAFLIGAVMSPTDPVFVSSIFRFDAVPERLKRLLNIESGLNDGLALPVIVLLLAHLSAGGQNTLQAFTDLALGGAVGVGISWLVVSAERLRVFGAAGIYKPLSAFSAGLMVLALCYVIHANLFIGAFTAGVTIATVSRESRESFEQFGEVVAELFKLAALLVFGAVIEPHLFQPLPAAQWIFVVLAVFGVRFAAVPLSLLGTGMDWKETLAAGWFGPKGFASMVYGLLILSYGLTHIAHLVGLMVVISIAVYSSTDILVGRWFESHEKKPLPQPETGEPADSA